MYEDLVAFTKFKPVQAGVVTDFSIRNARGNDGLAPPNRVAVGHYQIFTPTHLDVFRTSILARADIAGAVTPFDVQVNLTDSVGPTGGTIVDIFILNGLGFTDIADFVEVMLNRLPVGQFHP